MASAVDSAMVLIHGDSDAIRLVVSGKRKCCRSSSSNGNQGWRD